MGAEPTLPSPRVERAFAVGAATVAAALTLPLGASGLLALVWMLAAGGMVALTGLRLPRPAIGWLLAWLAWAALTALWSPASGAGIREQWARHAVLLGVPLMAVSVSGASAARALKAFVIGAAVLAGAWVVHAFWPWPPGRLLSSMVHYTGNKSIANGTLLALAAVLAGHWARQTDGRRRALWAGLGLALAAVLVWRSASRTAHLTLALLVLAWLLTVWRSRIGRLALLALAAAAVWAVVSGVAGGVGGLAARSAAGQLGDSSDHRRAVYAETLAMAAERPLAGHGLASWAVLWPKRSPLEATRGFNTAHSAPLEVLAETGAVGLALLLAVGVGWWRDAGRAGLRGAGAPAALVLLAWAIAAIFNAALRDLVFAAPFVVLLALALAHAREGRARGGAISPPAP